MHFGIAVSIDPVVIIKSHVPYSSEKVSDYSDRIELKYTTQLVLSSQACRFFTVETLSPLWTGILLVAIDLTLWHVE